VQNSGNNGLEIGADDYITKPFSPRVLSARVKALLRRSPADRLADSQTIRIHDLEIDPGRHIVRVGDSQVNLSHTEFQMLSVLARHPGWVFSRSQIVDAVHGSDYPVTDRSVDVQVVGLRKNTNVTSKRSAASTTASKKRHEVDRACNIRISGRHFLHITHHEGSHYHLD
jgi:DNA-binding response OmpR family regulator